MHFHGYGFTFFTTFHVAKMNCKIGSHDCKALLPCLLLIAKGRKYAIPGYAIAIAIAIGYVFFNNMIISQQGTLKRSLTAT